MIIVLSLNISFLYTENQLIELMDIKQREMANEDEMKKNKDK